MLEIKMDEVELIEAKKQAKEMGNIAHSITKGHPTQETPKQGTPSKETQIHKGEPKQKGKTYKCDKFS